MSRRPAILLLTIANIAVAGSAVAGEPRNLDPHKHEIRAYVESGDYDREIAAVAAQAKAWLAERAARRQPGERLAVVFDLDETLFRNWSALRANDFGYIPAAWDAWVQAAKAPAIEPVREVFRQARQSGVEVILLTGRFERERAATEKNLRAIGCAEWAALIFQPDNFKGATESFKTAQRKRLTAEGRTIAANVGDQESDLAGGYAERTFKLPNPFYLTP